MTQEVGIDSDGKLYAVSGGVGKYTNTTGAEIFNDYTYNNASGNYSHAEGYDTTASASYSHVEGYSTLASKTAAHAEGYDTTASGAYSHAEGYHTTASEHASHAEGHDTIASGTWSHAEGYKTTASGDHSHAEGYDTIASGIYSHTEGNGTLASGENQHVQGRYNVEDANSIYLHIVGNGTSKTARKNAHTLDKDGTAWFAGDVYVGSTSGKNKDDGSKKLATENFVNTAISSIPTPDVSGQITTHNTSTSAHNDIRDLITGLTTRLNTLADSDDTTLDQMSEIVAYIKSNKSLIEEITTNKVNVADIIDNLTTNATNKPLSAAQGVALKALIDAIDIPTKVGDLTNDKDYVTSTELIAKNYLTSVPSEYVTETELSAKGYLTSIPSEYVTESELTAKKYLTAVPSEYVTETELASKGYLTEHQSLADYVKSSELGALAKKSSVAKTDLASAVQTSLNKADTALQSYTETDPTVPSWAKASTKPSYTYSEVGADASGTASSVVNSHNTSATAHSDIREQISQLSNEKVELVDRVDDLENEVAGIRSLLVDGNEVSY